MPLSSNLPPAMRIILICAALIIIIAGIKSASDIVAPLLMAGFISIICARPLFLMQRWGIPTMIALIIILCFVGLLSAAVFGLITTSLDQFTQSLPRYRASLTDQYNAFQEVISAWGYSLPTEWLASQINPSSVIKLLNYMLSGVSNILGDGLIVFFAVLFILAEVAGLPEKLRKTLKNPDESLVRLQNFTQKVIHYLGLKAATSALTAACVILLLWILDVDYLFLWAILAFFLNFIPYVGSILAGLPAVLLALIDHGLFTALWVTTGYVAINIIVGNIIETRWMGEGLNLSSFVVFVSLMFWGWVLGPTGMFLSIPLTMFITIALESNPETHSIAELMQNQK